MRDIKKRTVILLAVAMAAMAVCGMDQEMVKLMEANHNRIGANMHSYEFDEITDVAAPAGYHPFYISHYGRHGSRSNWGDKNYKCVIDTLGKAQAEGNLTAAGAELIEIAKQVLAQYDGMDGRLSDRGEYEHSTLASRMYKRFTPVLSKEGTQVRSIGSLVPRCLISMAAFTNSLTRSNPTIRYNFDTGEKFQKYIDCAGGYDFNDSIMKVAADSLLKLIPDETETMMSKLFITPDQAQWVDAKRLQDAIYQTAIQCQDFYIDIDIYKYMSMQAVYKREMQKNYRLEVFFGNIPVFREMRQEHVRRGIADIVDKAEEAINGGEYSADLRFGHDLPLLALVSGLEIEGPGTRYELGEIEHNWYGWREICMASNLQLIFYKKAGNKDVLVKVLYNERERKITGLTETAPYYYRWEDVKAKWLAY